jgi:hypothetical protein
VLSEHEKHDVFLDLHRETHQVPGFVVSLSEPDTAGSLRPGNGALEGSGADLGWRRGSGGDGALGA